MIVLNIWIMCSGVKLICIYFVLICLPFSVNGQKNFSFFDGVVLSSSVGYSFGKTKDESPTNNAKVTIHSFDNLLDTSTVQENESQRSNVFTYDIELKYVFRAYKNFRVQAGLVYANNKMDFDYYSRPITVGYPVHLFHLEKNLDFYGFSYGISYSLNRLRFSLNESRVYRRVPSGEPIIATTDFYFYGVIDGNAIKEGYRVEPQFQVASGKNWAAKGGLTIEYRLFKEMYLALKLENFKDFFGRVRIQHAYVEKSDGEENQVFLGAEVIHVPNRRISLGLSYTFFSGKKRNRQKID